MQSNVRKMMQIAAMLFLVLGLAGTAWAVGGRWKVGHVVVCFGSGTCKVLSLGSAPATTTLDTIGDGTTFSPPGPILNPGDNRGVAINNTLHLLVTDAGASGTKANVVEYQIAGSDPTSGNAVAHGVATVFNSSGVGGIQTVALDKAGNMFILNANGSNPNIVKLDQTGAPVGSIPVDTKCSISQVASMDLSADGLSAYITSGGTIQKVVFQSPLSNSTCSAFANFGSGVTLYGIKDIPPNALPTSCPTATCPTSETILVVAKGSVDINTGESEPVGTDSDAVNVCTNTTVGSAESCALLLDTQASNPSLTGPVWAANNLYSTTSVTILDAFLHVQKVATPGTSGSDEPAWSQGGLTVRDNAVIWTDQGPRVWGVTAGAPPTAYSVGDIIIDPAFHVQQVTTAGKSGATQPNPWNDSAAPSFGGTTKDGLKWADQGQKLWAASTPYALNGIVVDSNGHVQKVFQAGTSGPSTPAFTSDNPNIGQTLDGLSWKNMGAPSGTPPAAWISGHQYFTVGEQVLDNNPTPCPCVEEVVTPGTSTPAATQPGPSGWNPNLNGTTFDNAVIWADNGGWTAAHTYNVGDTVGDTSSHLWQVTIGGISDSTTAPDFLTNPGGTVYEKNTVTWTDRGNWQPTTNYGLNAKVGDANLHLQQVATAANAGISGPGPNPPSFNDGTAGVTTTTDGLQWTDQGSSPSVVARYRVTQPSVQTSLQALALNPLIRDCTTLGSCSPTLPSPKVSNFLPPPKVSNFWLADSASGKFFGLDFETGTPTMFSTTVPNCTLCMGIQSIGIYGAEDAAQPGLTQLPSVQLSTAPSNPVNNTSITNTATFDFNPNPPASPSNNDDNQLQVTGYNFPSGFPPSGSFALTVYASAIDPASGFSDSLLTPTPPPNAPVLVPPVKCTVATSIFGGNPTGQCVVWQLDNNELPTIATCATKPSTCPFLWVKLDFFNATVRAATNFNNVLGVLDEQYDSTASPDTGFPKVKCQLSQHTISPTVPGATNCTYLSPLPPSSSSSSSPACFTTSRTNIPVKFTCASLPTGKTLADLLPFLHVVQLFPPIPGGNEASLQPLQGTGGTVNYRLTSGQWNFNFNNPGFGYGPSPSTSGPRTDYLVWTGDANHVVENFYTRFYVKKSCP